MFHRWAGNWAGWLSAVGHNVLKSWKSHLDNESAITLSTPSTYFALNKILCLRVNKTKFLTRAITLSDFEVFLSRIATTAWLSLWNKNFLFFKEAPQMLIATTIGNISKMLYRQVTNYLSSHLASTLEPIFPENICQNPYRPLHYLHRIQWSH